MPPDSTPSSSSPSLPCAPEAIDAFIGTPTAEVVSALAAQPGPVLVLGAGGKLGLHFTHMLDRAMRQLGRSDPVIAVSRFQTLRGREDFERLGLTTLACDLEDPAALAALPDAPTVIFLAGVKFGTNSDPALLQRVNVDLPRQVADRYARSRIIAFSSGAVYPFLPSGSRGASEATQPDPVGAYAASCREREKAFEAGSRRHGTPVVLLRLNYAVEFRYGVLVDIAQRVLAQAPLDVTMGHVNVIWQTDAIAQSIQALALAASPAVPLNITGSSVLSVRDLASQFGQIFGVAPVLVGREADTALLSDSSYACRVLGEPKTSLQQMIQWIAAWLKIEGGTWGKPTGFQIRNGAY